jgi:hypothetical protein
MNTFLTATALAVGLPVGFAATAAAAPVSNDFWECAADHSDDIGVCCVFYGGDYDERTGECWIDHEAKPEEASDVSDGPGVAPQQPALTRVVGSPVIKVS